MAAIALIKEKSTFRYEVAGCLQSSSENETQSERGSPVMPSVECTVQYGVKYCTVRYTVQFSAVQYKKVYSELYNIKQYSP